MRGTKNEQTAYGKVAYYNTSKLLHRAQKYEKSACAYCDNAAIGVAYYPLAMQNSQEEIVTHQG